MHSLGSYDLRLVALSIVVAALASFTALDLAGRIRAARNWSRYAWLAAAALAMGGGIWSMHFIGMLAFSMPGMMVSYDFGLTLLSLALPIAVTAFGFVVAIQPDTRWVGLLLSGIFMGSGIAGMHYTGMAAMRMNAQLSYEWWWVGISVAIAIGWRFSAPVPCSGCGRPSSWGWRFRACTIPPCGARSSPVSIRWPA